MSKILIVGAGQAGLQLAFGLVQDGHDVTVVSNRTPEDVRDGRVMSSQCMFDAALQHERDLHVNFWEDECPPIDGISLAVPTPDGSGAKAIDWSSRLDGYAQSVDQRVKIHGWMGKLEEAGGNIVIDDVGVDELERQTQDNDLVIVAAGKGEIVRLFERDAERSPYDQPMRALALTYVTGMTPRPEHSAVCFNLVPTVGEYFVFPALTTTGVCEIMVFEGIPGGPMDCWGDVTTPAEHLAKSKWILDTFMPWEAERCRSIELTDENGVLAGRFPPTVRKPVAELPSGRLVLGLADTIMLNDPITGQGSNNAAKMAAAYREAIRAHGDAPYDRPLHEAGVRGLLERVWPVHDHLDERASLAPARACVEAPRRRQRKPGACPSLRERVQRSGRLFRLVHVPRQGRGVPGRGRLGRYRGQNDRRSFGGAEELPGLELVLGERFDTGAQRVEEGVRRLEKVDGVCAVVHRHDEPRPERARDRRCRLPANRRSTADRKEEDVDLTDRLLLLGGATLPGRNRRSDRTGLRRG